MSAACATTAILPQRKLQRNAAGTFQKMGLNVNVLKGIRAMGYNLPTPIQRKTIPVILDGHDIVAMARTGSGKSAAFLIPLIHLLGEHSLKVGSRALILSPTRELALQTAKFAKQLSKYTDLRVCIIVGGEAIEEQFRGLSYNADLLIATPGRLSYLLKEIATFNLRCLQYLVYDEADRLFEMGFAVQLKTILDSLSKTNRVHKLMFSATMPKTVMQFTRATLLNPVLIRLDTEIKISPNLQLSYLHCRADDKLAVLLYLLQKLVHNDDKLILIFAATRYHVELVEAFLKGNDFECVSCFGSMEQEYRNVNINKFRNKKVNIMVVTDVASRGIDIPLLDYVINFQMTTSPKCFVHRVGRVARNGKYGVAISIVQPDELPYVADVYAFLAHSLPTEQAQTDDDEDDEEKEEEESDKEKEKQQQPPKHPSLLFEEKTSFGMVPSRSLLPYVEAVIDQFRKNDELEKLSSIANKAMDIYNRTKLKPSKHGIRNAKQINCRLIHPLFADEIGKKERQTLKLMENISSFKPKSTVFEMGGSLNPNYEMMQTQRNKLNTALYAHDKKLSVKLKQSAKQNHREQRERQKQQQQRETREEITAKYRDNEFFIETEGENGGADGMQESFVDDMMQISSNDNDQLKQFIMELDDDERKSINVKKKLYRFNPNTRRYVTEFMGDRMLRYFREKNECNQNINAARHKYGKLYEEWKMKSKREIGVNGSTEKELKVEDAKSLGLRKHRHIQGTNAFFDKQRERKKLSAIKMQQMNKEKQQKVRVQKLKRQRFAKWWQKNRDKVKSRKAKRRNRGF